MVFAAVCAFRTRRWIDTPMCGFDAGAMYTRSQLRWYRTVCSVSLVGERALFQNEFHSVEHSHPIRQQQVALSHQLPIVLIFIAVSLLITVSFFYFGCFPHIGEIFSVSVDKNVYYTVFYVHKKNNWNIFPVFCLCLRREYFPLTQIVYFRTIEIQREEKTTLEYSEY